MLNSSRLCRLLRLNFIQDNDGVTWEEKEFIDKEIKEFEPTETPRETVEFSTNNVGWKGRI